MTGDSPHYLIAAQALEHFSVHPLGAYVRDFRTHEIYAWPRGASVKTVRDVQSYTHTWFGPHGVVFAQGIGLALIVAPFMAIGSVPLAFLGFFAIDAAGLVYIFVRGSRLAGLGGLGRVVFAVALFSPALWLASTQLYPDLIAGVLLGCALIEIGAFERTGRLGWRAVVVVSAVFAVVPWFQIKNFSVVVLGLGALAIVAFVQSRSRYRTRILPESGTGASQARRVVVVAVVAIGSFALLVLYNQFYFGHLLGLPQPNPNFGIRGITHTIDLVVDRDQGALVQCPVLIVGLLGLLFSRRESPVTSVLVIAAVGSILIINGTQPSYNDFGGVALAGRFEWTIVPMVLAWCPKYLRRLEARRWRLGSLGVVVATLWMIEAVPILVGDHRYFNESFAPFAPWDPSLYPGWWKGIDPYLPSVVTPFSVSRVLLVLLIAATGAFLLMELVREGSFPLLSAVGATGVCVVLIVAAGPMRELPSAPLRWSVSEIGGPWIATKHRARFGPTQITTGGVGLYEVKITAPVVSGPSGSSRSAEFSVLTSPVERSVVSNWFTPKNPTSASEIEVYPHRLNLSNVQVATASFGKVSRVARSRSATIYVHIARPSVFSFRVTVSPMSTLTVTSVELSKVSN